MRGKSLLLATRWAPEAAVRAAAQPTEPPKPFQALPPRPPQGAPTTAAQRPRRRTNRGRRHADPRQPHDRSAAGHVLDRRRSTRPARSPATICSARFPQAGDVSVQPANNPQTSNAARGDVNSINLRNLGTGNTLVLLNGRRLVSASDQPGRRRQRPGARLQRQFAAGRRARAARDPARRRGGHLRRGRRRGRGQHGHCKSDFDGVSLDYRYGWAEGTHRKEHGSHRTGGINFAGGPRQHHPLSRLRPAHRAIDVGRDYTATKSIVPVRRRPAFLGSLVPDDRATQSPWANLAVVGGPARSGRSPGNQALTSAAGAFHTQSLAIPAACHDQCRDLLGSRHARDRDDASQRSGSTMRRHDGQPSIRRFNSVPDRSLRGQRRAHAYGEAAITGPIPRASSRRSSTSTRSSSRVQLLESVRAGHLRQRPGQSQPDPGLTNVPTAGLPVRLTTYRFVDAGPQRWTVKNSAVALPDRPARRPRRLGTSTPPFSIPRRRRPTVSPPST
jgi:iron complex outermembrane receptor protein